MVRSKITNLEYNPDKVAYILNMKQVYLYMPTGAQLLDILYSDTKANALVFVFEKNEQLKKLYELWNQHELN